MTDAELLQCLDRFPAGEPITLYHVDATGKLVKAIQESGGKVALRPGEFWLTTNVETRGGFKGGAGLDRVLAFKLDRRFVSLLADLALTQRTAGQAEDIGKIFEMMGIKGVNIAVPRVNFEGGGKGRTLPEGDVNISLRMTREAPEMARLFELSIQEINLARLEPSKPPGQRMVRFALIKPPARPGQPPPDEAALKAELNGRMESIMGGVNRRAEAFGGGTLLALDAVAAIFRFFNNRYQQKRVEEAIKQVEEEIGRHRVMVPTDGVLLQFYYLLRGAADADPNTPMQPLPDFQFLEVLYGKTPDEAKLTLPPMIKAGGPRDTYQVQSQWIPPLIPPSPKDLMTPFKKVALGTFAAGKSWLQQVEFNDFFGFDDEQQMFLKIPKDTTVSFIVLNPPHIIKWAASPWSVSTVAPPIRREKTASGDEIEVIDLDPDLGAIFTRVTATPVFPADDDTEDVFLDTHPTVDQTGALNRYPNFGKVRWVRPENIVITGFLNLAGKVEENKAEAPKPRIVAPPDTPAPPTPQAPQKPKPDPAFIPKPWELASKDQWGQLLDGNPPVYIVAPNDSLWKIAERLYGTGAKADQLFEANKGRIDPVTKTIYPGQKLKAPGAKPPGSPPPSTPPPGPQPGSNNIA